MTASSFLFHFVFPAADNEERAVAAAEEQQQCLNLLATHRLTYAEKRDYLEPRGELRLGLLLR